MIVYTIFCDDVREEKSNKKSFIGVYEDSLVIENTPALLPKFFIATHLRLDKNDKLPNNFTVKVKFPGGEIEMDGSLQKTIKEIGHDKHVVSIIGEFSPFVIEDEGKIEVSLKTDTRTKAFPAGSLLIKKGK